MAAATGEGQAGIPSDRRRLIAWLCIGVAILEGFDLQVAGVAAPAIAASLSLDPATLGLFFSASTFGLLFGALLGGWIADRVGRMEALAVSCAMFGIASVATGYADSAGSLIAMRALTGLGLGGALPNLIALTSQSACAGRERRAVAILYCGVPIGGIAVSLFGAAMPDRWPALFFIGGALPVLLSVLLWRLRSIAGRPERRSAGNYNPIRTLFGEGRAAPTLLVWAAFFAMLVILYLVLNWLPTLLAAAGLSTRQALLAQVLFNTGGFAACLASAPLLDGRRAWLIAAGAFGAIPMLLVLMSLPNDACSSLGLAFFLGASILTTQSYLYGLAPTIYPPETGGTGVGAAVAWGRIGSIAGPIFGAWALGATNSPASVLSAIIPVSIVAGIAAIAIPPALGRARSRLAAIGSVKGMAGQGRR